MKPARITLGEFVVLRQQLPAAALPGLVDRIERSFRAALGLEGWDDEAIIVALYHPDGQTDLEQAGVRVLRWCIAYRESAADDRHGALDGLAIALADADPVRVTGTSALRRSANGGRKTGARRTGAKADADDAILRAARAILHEEPQIKRVALAAILADRGHGGSEAIRKRLPRLLGKKSCEGK